MTSKSEELREQIAKLNYLDSGDDEAWEYLPLTKPKGRGAYLQSYKEPYLRQADKSLSLIYALFGGQSNFEAVLKLVEQTRGKCEKCNGTGQEPFNHPASDTPTTRYCIWCHGSGLGKVQIGRLVMLDDNQAVEGILCFASQGEAVDRLLALMHNQGFRKVKEGK